LYGTAGIVPLDAGVIVILIDLSDEVRFRVAALAEVYAIVNVAALPPVHVGCVLAFAVTVGGLGGAATTGGG